MLSLDLLFESNALSDYLMETEEVDFSHPLVCEQQEKWNRQELSDIEKINLAYEFVRDQIPHSWDIQSEVITRTASEVLEKGTGICFAKSNLLAALLRGMGIPCGFCYQRLMIFDTPEKGYSLHGFNAVYIESLEKWVRIDARGNKPGVQAEFSPTSEKLAFTVDEKLGEKTFPYVFVRPNEKTMQVLKESNNAVEMYKYHLPDQL